MPASTLLVREAGKALVGDGRGRGKDDAKCRTIHPNGMDRLMSAASVATRNSLSF